MRSAIMAYISRGSGSGRGGGVVVEREDGVSIKVIPESMGGD